MCRARARAPPRARAAGGAAPARAARHGARRRPRDDRALL